MLHCLSDFLRIQPNILKLYLVTKSLTMAHYIVKCLSMISRTRRLQFHISFRSCVVKSNQVSIKNHLYKKKNSTNISNAITTFRFQCSLTTRRKLFSQFQYSYFSYTNCLQCRMLGYMRQLKDVAMNIWRLKHILVCTVEVLKFYYAIIK